MQWMVICSHQVKIIEQPSQAQALSMWHCSECRNPRIYQASAHDVMALSRLAVLPPERDNPSAQMRRQLDWFNE